MKRRPKGSGSIDQLPSGRFRVRLADGMGAPIRGTFATRTDAEGALRGAIAILAEQQLAPTGSTTLAQWADLWFREREARGYRGVHEERSCWRNRIAPYSIATLPLVTITRAHVRTWIEEIRAVPVMRRSRKGRVIRTTSVLMIGSLRRIRAVLRSMLGAAVEREMIPANPAGGFPLTAPAAAPRWTYLTASEIEHVITHDLIPARFRWLYTVAIFTGLRRGEMWAIRWRDVTLDGDRPHIYVRGSHATTTKTGRERIVPLLPRAREALQRLRDLAGDVDASAFVFATSTGAQRGKNDRGQWGRNGESPGYRVVAGFTRRVPFHAFRHTCASALLQGYWGAPWTLADVRDMLGHSSIKTTERYAHLSTEHLHARARDIRDVSNTVTTPAIPAANDVLRQVSITHDGTASFTGESRSIGSARDVTVTLSRALPEAVEAGVAVGVTVRALVESCRGTQWEAMAGLCTGRHAVRRALDLCEAIERDVAAGVADAPRTRRG